jgi:pre-mRNA-splicing factor SYF1
MLAWAEMHVRHSNLDSAIEILKYACCCKQSQLTHNLKCWQMLIDLLSAKHASDPGNSHLEQEVKDAYTKTLDLKIATPALVLNFSRYLQAKCSLFEESFRVFERAIDMFPWPHKYEIWLEYLKVMV